MAISIESTVSSSRLSSDKTRNSIFSFAAATFSRQEILQISAAWLFRRNTWICARSTSKFENFFAQIILLITTISLQILLGRKEGANSNNFHWRESRSLKLSPRTRLWWLGCAKHLLPGLCWCRECKWNTNWWHFRHFQRQSLRERTF